MPAPPRFRTWEALRSSPSAPITPKKRIRDESAPSSGNYQSMLVGLKAPSVAAATSTPEGVGRAFSRTAGWSTLRRKEAGPTAGLAHKRSDQRRHGHNQPLPRPAGRHDELIGQFQAANTLNSIVTAAMNIVMKLGPSAPVQIYIGYKTGCDHGN